jgi:hypothetical protein
VRPKASGSDVSRRQIEWAAKSRRQVRFVTVVETIIGYVVGQDDYHWKVAAIGQQSDVEVVLVHKGQTPVVRFPDRMLDQEPEVARTSIEKIGTAYWKTLHADTQA